MNAIATTIFGLLFMGVTILGFAASRWRKGDLNELHEWGLGGRSLGDKSRLFRCASGSRTARAISTSMQPSAMQFTGDPQRAIRFRCR
jgi:hypothetical protein